MDTSRRRFLVVAIGMSLLSSAMSFGGDDAASTAKGLPERRITRASGPIVVDGKLDEAAWRDAAAFELRWEITPGENTPAPVRTVCRMTYDRSRLYIGCRAWDDDPAAIRAHYTDRDSAWSDDFVGVILDTFDDERRGYEFFVNPLGVQMDLTKNDVGGGEDASWDAIWDSAGRITAQGYEVEMAVPFSVLRFPAGGRAMRWGVSFMRVFPRTHRVILASNPVDRNVDCSLCQMQKVVGFEGVRPGKNLELDPTLVLDRTDVRRDFPDGPMEAGDVKIDGGLTARWGVTPNVEVAGTLNPDFSQIEADALQLDVNRTFTLFYPEKRPFFLEGADIFDMPLSVVHTRTIADPNWGVKTTGKAGRSAFGALVAQDAVTSVIVPGNEGSWSDTLDGSNLAGIFRYRYDLGRGSTLGGVVTSRHGEGGYGNDVWGIDGMIRLGPSDTVTFQALGSSTTYPARWAEEHGLERSVDGSAFSLSYDHSARNWSWFASWDDLGAGFRADLGFEPRVDTRTAAFGGFHTWWGTPSDWYTDIKAGGQWNEVTDHSGNVLRREAEVWGRIAGPWQSKLWVNLTSRDVAYAGRRFDQRRAHMFFGMRPSGAVSFRLFAMSGDDIDYANVRPGDVLSFGPSLGLRLGRHLELSLDTTWERLDVAGGRLYRASLSELRTVYQISLRTFVRAVLQYTDIWRDPALYGFPVDRTSRRLFGQFLFSYKVNPQTVLFLGYSEGGFGRTGLDITRENRTFFVKLGYAWLL